MQRIVDMRSIVGFSVELCSLGLSMHDRAWENIIHIMSCSAAKRPSKSFPTGNQSDPTIGFVYHALRAQDCWVRTPATSSSTTEVCAIDRSSAAQHSRAEGSPAADLVKAGFVPFMAAYNIQAILKQVNAHAP